MKSINCVLAFCLISFVAQAGITISPWSPIFKGIELASGQAVPDGTVVRLQQMRAYRIDLRDPDIQFFTTPRNTNGTSETLGQNTSLFLKTYGLQVAVNANFYDPCCSSPPNSPMNVIGLSISRGVVVSAQEGTTDSANLLITSNNVPTIVANNYPPQGTNRAYNAVSGHYVVLANGVNLGFSTPEANTPNPRTAAGISQDGHYMILMTIDGRQTGWSDGAIDSETADWLIRLGSYNGVNLDGGGSTTMIMADCGGSPLQVNRPIDSGIPGRERVIANNLGVYAKPLPYFVSNIVVAPYDTTATITWQTPVPATTYVEYGPTTSYGSVSSDSTLLKNHVVTLNGLTPGSTYYYRLTATGGSGTYPYACNLQTTAPNANRSLLFDVTKSWKYTTNNLDGINWQAPGYNDSAWSGPGPGLLYCESSGSVNPKNTGLPPTGGPQITGTVVSPSYYFRTHFTFSGTPVSGSSLLFSNYIDDGAVFYLNGVEIQRVRMAPAPNPITYTSVTYPAGAFPCTGDATCPDLFTVSGSLMSNLVAGDNVLATEVHQYNNASYDIVFGSALWYTAPGSSRPTLNMIREGNTMTLYWNGSGFTLQQATDALGSWNDVPGPITNSTYAFQIPDGVNFFRLRN